MDSGRVTERGRLGNQDPQNPPCYDATRGRRRLSANLPNYVHQRTSFQSLVSRPNQRPQRRGTVIERRASTRQRTRRVLVRWTKADPREQRKRIKHQVVRRSTAFESR